MHRDNGTLGDFSPKSRLRAAKTGEMRKHGSRRTRIGLLTLAALAVTSFGLVGCSESTGPTYDEVQTLEEELTAAQDANHEASNEIERLEEEIEELEVKLHDAEAPYETAEDDAYLDEEEWQQGLIAAKILLGDGAIAPGAIPLFVEAVSQEEGVYWSAAEQKEFLRRYRDWYRENKARW